jgi:hypothetical protein
VQPVQEGGGVGDLVADVVDLLVGSGLAVEAAAQAAQMVPDGVGVQGALVLWGLTRGDCLLDPRFERGQALVARRQRAGGDEHGADVRESAAGRHRVQGLMGDRGPHERDGAQGVADAGFVQPVQRVVGAVDLDEGLAQLVQLRRGDAVSGGEDPAEVAIEGTACALGRGELPRDSADPASCPERRIGVDASGAQRFVQRAAFQ